VSLAPGVRFGPHEILTLVGAGGMGEVYTARDMRLDRTVAIKVLPPHAAENPEARQRFDREARAISALQHPHICTLHDVGHQDGFDFLVMEYLEGETLKRRLLRGPLPLGDVFRYGSELAGALDHAHRRGIVHSDIKPSNVMLTKTGAMLLDFGIVKWQATESERESDGSLSQTLSLPAEEGLVGTLRYMAPEQFEGKKADPRADIFALGSVLYEMTTGRKAFDAPTRTGVIASIAAHDPRPIRELQPLVSPALERVVMKCLAKDPDRRWQIAHDVADELMWIARGGSQDAMGTLNSRAATPGRLGWILAGVFLVLAGVLTFLMVTNWPRPASTEHQVRFVVDPPEASRFVVSGAFMSASPDGRHVVYMASVPDGKQLLWDRALDTLDARPLAGTDGGIEPFWSPDSRAVAFFADGKLKKITIAGGRPQTLADAPAPQGGTWNRDDVIVFAPEIGTGLYRVAAVGGPTAPVEPVVRTRGGVFIGWPHFLPDGRHFLYRAAGTGVFLGSLDSRERRQLLNVDSNAVYVQPGYLLFQREGTLLAQPFDINNRFRVSGEPFVVAAQLTYNPTNGRGSFSASDDGVLAYRLANETQLVWFDRHGTQLSAIGPSAQFADPALSPDETRVAVTRADPRTGTSDIWLFDTVRGLGSQFTFEPSSEQMPLWSPDGREIVFSSNSRGLFDLYRKPVVGTGREEPVLTSPGNKRSLDWSRDGRFVLFGQGPALDNRPRGVWAVPMVGDRTPTPIHTPSEQASAQFAPDGRWVAYVSNESGANEVYVGRFPIDDARWRISTNGGIEPRWRRDMRELFYLAPTGDLMAVPLSWDSSPHAGSPTVLFRTPFGDLTNITGRNHYDVATDGQRFLMTVPRSGTASSPITVVLNWATGLPRQ
jgi:Tol biopolymer transport system component